MFGLVGYHRVTSKKPPSFCVTVFISGLTKLTILLSQSHYCSYNVIRRKLAPPPLWLQEHTDLDAREFAHSPDMWHQPKLANINCLWSWILHEINPAFRFFKDFTATFCYDNCLSKLFDSIRRVNGSSVISFWSYFTLCGTVKRVLIIVIVTARDTPARLRF